MWFPCWNGCDPHQVICGENYDVCEVADPEPCIATCLCPSEEEVDLVFLTEHGACGSASVCKSKYVIHCSMFMLIVRKCWYSQFAKR